MSMLAMLDKVYTANIHGRLLKVNAEVVNALDEDPGMKNDRGDVRFGGYYCLGNEYGQPLLSVLVGRVPLIDAPRYKGFAEEKVNRLGIVRQSRLGHNLSRESEMPELGRFRGAIAGPYSNSAIRAFSGYPGSVDEIISAWMGVTEKDFEAKWAMGALASARNEYLERLQHLFSPEFLAPYLA